MINPTAASATGTGSALRPFLLGIAGFLLAVLLVFLASADSQAQQPPPRPGPPPAGPKAQPPRRRPERSARGRHHPGHAEAHPDRHPGVPGRGSAFRASRCPTWSRPTWSARACSSRSTGPPSSIACATSTRRRASRTGGPSMPRRWWSGGPAGRRTGGWSASFASGTCFPGRQLAASDSPSPRRTGAGWPSGGRPGVRAAHRREGLFRHPGRLHRRDRPQGAPQQAPRHHGPGRRQHAAAEPGRELVLTPALQPHVPGDHLHAVHRRPAARVPA